MPKKVEKKEPPPPKEKITAKKTPDPIKVKEVDSDYGSEVDQEKPQKKAVAKANESDDYGDEDDAPKSTQKVSQPVETDSDDYGSEDEFG